MPPFTMTPGMPLESTTLWAQPGKPEDSQPFLSYHCRCAPVTLLQTIHLATKITIVHGAAHTKETDTMSLGTVGLTRQITAQLEMGPLSLLYQFINLLLSPDVIDYQANILQSEKDKLM